MSSTMLGARQESWLDDGLANGATWNLLAQQVLVAPYTRFKADDPTPFTSTDIWDGYRPARARLINSVRRHNLNNVVIVSGDFHRNIIGTVPADDQKPDGDQVMVEFLATSISSNGNGGPLPEVERELPLNPHIKMINNIRGYHLHDITPLSWQTDVKAVDQVQTSGGQIRQLEHFVVQPDCVYLNQ